MCIYSKFSADYSKIIISSITSTIVEEVLEANGIHNITSLNLLDIKANELSIRICTNNNDKKLIRYCIVKREEEELRLYIRTNICIEL